MYAGRIVLRVVYLNDTKGARTAGIDPLSNLIEIQCYLSMCLFVSLCNIKMWLWIKYCKQLIHYNSCVSLNYIRCCLSIRIVDKK